MLISGLIFQILTLSPANHPAEITWRKITFYKTQNSLEIKSENIDLRFHQSK